MRYVCKKCGKFVSQHSEECKSCGTKNPAILPEERKQNDIVDERELIECPYCNIKFDSKNYSNNKVIHCPKCGRESENPYYEKNTPSKSRMIIGFIVLIIIIVNIYRAFNQGESPNKIEVDTTTSNNYSIPGNNLYNNASRNNQGNNDIASYEPKSHIEKREHNNINKKNYTLTLRENGSSYDDPIYLWELNDKNGKISYKYIITDGYQSNVLKSGKGEVMKFSILKSKYPSLTLSRGYINPDDKIYFLYNIDTHYNIDDSERKVNALISLNASTNTIKIYMNDSDNPYEYIYLNTASIQSVK